MGLRWTSGGKYEFPSSYISAIDRRFRSPSLLFGCPGWLSPRCYVEDGATFSPDGQRLAFQVSLHDGSGQRIGSELVVMTVDGGASSRVSVGRFVGPPAWSPDGACLLVAGAVGPEPVDGTLPQTDLFVIGLDGKAPERLTHGGASRPDWAVDGTIAFAREGQIHVVLRGGDSRQLTWRGGSAPSWAPDARRIAFARDGQVWSVGADGRSPRRLTSRGGASPAWSPDGRRLAFTRPHGEIDGLWTMRADGKAPRFTGEQGGPYGYSSIGDPAWRALATR